MITWHDNTPIYRQLKTRLIQQILEGSMGEGEAAPSVRQVAGELQLNPITVSRSYQELQDEGILEKRRGVGLFVAVGARQALLEHERKRFLQDEWPLVMQRMKLLQLTLDDLPSTFPTQGS